MSKFDGLKAPRPQPNARNAHGFPGFARSPKADLVLLGAANFVSEDTFYESAKHRDSRFVALVGEMTRADAEWTAQFVAWLRGSANMRSAAIVAAATYVKAGGPNGRRVVSSACLRADEPGEFLAFWKAVYGEAVPKPVKRGLADAVQRLYHERSMLKWDGQGKNWRFGDVVRLVHPRPQTALQADLFRHAIERRNGWDRPIPESLALLRADRDLQRLPESQRRANLANAVALGWTWERLAGWLPGGMDAEAWEAVIPNMGVMALARNLRNFDQAGISTDAVRLVEDKMRSEADVRASRAFPLRFLAAWKAVNSLRWGQALEDAVALSMGNVPHLTGRTLVLIDVSPSMLDDATTKGPGNGNNPPPPGHLARWEVAGLFGLTVAERSDEADVFAFDKDSFPVDFGKGSSILRTVEQMGALAEKGIATDTLGAIADRYVPGRHDRVVIITDEQTGCNAGGRYDWSWHRSQYPGRDLTGTFRTWADVEHVRVPVFTFNLGGFTTAHGSESRKWLTVGGLSDACFGILGRGASIENPWEAEQRANDPKPVAP